MSTALYTASLFTYSRYDSVVNLPQQLLEQLFRREAVFTALALGMIALSVPLLIAQQLDARTIAGVNIWIKPLKFTSALFVYSLTLAWYASWVPEAVRQSRRYKIYAGVVASCVVLEMIWIISAASMGTISHFNNSSLVWGMAYGFMGIAAITLTSASLVYGIAILRNHHSGLQPAIRLSLGIGLILTFVLTLAVAGYMSGTTSHLVAGNTSDVEALAIMGWARDGGDLRVAHFFATHALHAVPIMGLLASKYFRGRLATITVILAGAAYTWLVVFTFLQALAGKPILQNLPL